MQQRLIFHVDVNSAFLSWEAARCASSPQASRTCAPSSAIGGDRDKRTGIILAKSIPAKKFGVTTGEPVGMALRKCPQLVLAPPALYAQFVPSSPSAAAAARGGAGLDRRMLPRHMSGTHLLYPTVAVAHQIKDAIFPSSASPSTSASPKNKLLAKMASDFESPIRSIPFFPAEIPQKFPGRCPSATCSPSAVPLPKSSLPPASARSAIWPGPRLPAEAHRRPHRRPPASTTCLRRRPPPVLAEPEAVKCYGNSTHPSSRTSPPSHRPIRSCSPFATASPPACADSRRCLCLTVTIRGSDFKTAPTSAASLSPATSRRSSMPAPSPSSPNPGTVALRLLGVTLSDLTDGQTQQLSLFPDEKRDCARKLDQVVDQLRGQIPALPPSPAAPHPHHPPPPPQIYPQTARYLRPVAGSLFVNI